MDQYRIESRKPLSSSMAANGAPAMNASYSSRTFVSLTASAPHSW